LQADPRETKNLINGREHQPLVKKLNGRLFYSAFRLRVQQPVQVAASFRSGLLPEATATSTGCCTLI